MGVQCTMYVHAATLKYICRESSAGQSGDVQYIYKVGAVDGHFSFPCHHEKPPRPPAPAPPALLQQGRALHPALAGQQVHREKKSGKLRYFENLKQGPQVVDVATATATTTTTATATHLPNYTGSA
jgi:hypothetical protein